MVTGFFLMRCFEACYLSLTGIIFSSFICILQMNLASQSVLEGLNACLDHRGEVRHTLCLYTYIKVSLQAIFVLFPQVYIPELGMAFKVQLGTRLFACQNPLQQGGGRKGLPKSFLNRFTQVKSSLVSVPDPNPILSVDCYTCWIGRFSASSLHTAAVLDCILQLY